MCFEGGELRACLAGGEKGESGLVWPLSVLVLLWRFMNGVNICKTD